MKPWKIEIASHNLAMPWAFVWVWTQVRMIAILETYRGVTLQRASWVWPGGCDWDSWPKTRCPHARVQSRSGHTGARCLSRAKHAHSGTGEHVRPWREPEDGRVGKRFGDRRGLFHIFEQQRSESGPWCRTSHQERDHITSRTMGRE